MKIELTLAVQILQRVNGKDVIIRVTEPITVGLQDYDRPHEETSRIHGQQIVLFNAMPPSTIFPSKATPNHLF